MKQTKFESNGNAVKVKPRKAAGSEEIYIKSTLFLNKRSEGFCDCCLKKVPPSELIRNFSRTIYNETEFTIVSYLCARCKG